eukprot:1089-Amphidinium_carterae.1
MDILKLQPKPFVLFLTQATKANDNALSNANQTGETSSPFEPSWANLSLIFIAETAYMAPTGSKAVTTRRCVYPLDILYRFVLFLKLAAVVSWTCPIVNSITLVSCPPCWVQQLGHYFQLRPQL